MLEYIVRNKKTGKTNTLFSTSWVWTIVCHNNNINPTEWDIESVEYID